MAEPRSGRLRGRRLLIVEDEYLVAIDLVDTFEGEGAEVVGPAGTVQDALELVASGGAIDAAVLDVNLRGEKAYPVADALLDRGVPFVFTTGYDGLTIPQAYADAPRLEKPVDLRALTRMLLKL